MIRKNVLDECFQEKAQLSFVGLLIEINLSSSLYGDIFIYFSLCSVFSQIYVTAFFLDYTTADNKTCE